MQIPFIKCPQKHSTDSIYLICINQSCPKSRLVCLQCHPNSHKDHQLITISDLISLMKNSQNPTAGSDYHLLSSFKSQIATQIENFHSLLSAFSQNITKLTSDLNRLNAYINPDNQILYIAQNVNHSFSQIFYQFIQPHPNRTEIERYLDYIVPTIKKDEQKLRIHLPYQNVFEDIKLFSSKFDEQIQKANELLSSYNDKVVKGTLRVFKTFENSQAWKQMSSMNILNDCSFNGVTYSRINRTNPPYSGSISIFGQSRSVFAPKDAFLSRKIPASSLFANNSSDSFIRVKQLELGIQPNCCFMSWEIPPGVTNWGLKWIGTDILMGVGIPEIVIPKVSSNSYQGEGCVMFDTFDYVSKANIGSNNQMNEGIFWFEFNSHKGQVSMMAMIGQSKHIQTLDLDQTKIKSYKIGAFLFKQNCTVALVNEGKPIFK